jgi:uncharacterized protein (TIGR03083 family)
MDTAAYVEQVRRAGHHLADVADGQLDRAVPSCPDWTVADLVDHMAEVVDFWGAIASGRAASPDAYVRPPTPGPDELVGWYRSLLERAIDELSSVDPATPRWNWTGDDQDAAWIIRRMANETAVHCWDGEAAVDAAQPLGRPIAVDGVDEFWDVFAPAWVKHLDGPSSTIHLHATDGPGEWFATVGNGALQVERVHAKGDVAVRGTASDLVLMLWNRVDAGQLELHGDRAGLDRFLATVRIG